MAKHTTYKASANGKRETLRRRQARQLSGKLELTRRGA